MRKFRTAALAIATATTVAVSGMSVASAETVTNPDGHVVLSDNPTLDKIRQGLDSKGSLEWDKTANARDIFGSDSWKNNEEIAQRVPMWAKVADSLLIATAVASVFGLLVAPAYNFLRYGLAR